jgi:DNA polymerase-3 subunit delta'
MEKSSIVGHDDLLDQLKTDLAQENVAHAYLFTGPERLGKMTVARWFATELLTAGQSEAQQEIIRHETERLMHPDLLILDQLWIEEVSEDWEQIAQYSNIPQTHRAKKPAAKTDTIGIDDVRALQERLYETAAGTWRCCIIRDVDRMQDEASNAFLKILEEPPNRLVFILTTRASASLLPTVISRTRVMRFHKVSQGELRILLEGVAPDDARFILHVAQGAPGAVCALRDDPDLLRAARLVHAQAQSFWNATTLRERMQILKPLHERSASSDEFLLHLFLTLREQTPRPEEHTVRALIDLTEGLETNAHRELLAQRFALAI